MQLKARLVISKNTKVRTLYLAFPGGDNWYLVQHDALSDIAAETTPWLRSPSWIKDGQYSVAEPLKQMLDRLSAYTLGPRAFRTAGEERQR